MRHVAVACSIQTIRAYILHATAIHLVLFYAVGIYTYIYIYIDYKRKYLSADGISVCWTSLRRIFRHLCLDCMCNIISAPLLYRRSRRRRNNDVPIVRSTLYISHTFVQPDFCGQRDTWKQLRAFPSVLYTQLRVPLLNTVIALKLPLQWHCMASNHCMISKKEKNERDYNLLYNTVW